MDVVVKLQPDFAAAARSGNVTSNGEPLSLLKLYDLALKPMHANRSSGPLSTFFVVDAPATLAETVRSELSETDGVESAYIAPEVALP